MPGAFSLEAVLRLRQHTEEAEERTLLALTTHRQQVEATLGRVRQQKLLWAEDRRREVGCLAPGSTQQGVYARLALLHEAERQLQVQMADLQKRSAEQQAIYLAARSAREILSSLQTTQQNQAQQRQERREQRRLEDLLLGRWLVKERATRQILGKNCRAE